MKVAFSTINVTGPAGRFVKAKAPVPSVVTGGLSDRRALDRDTRARHGGAGRAVHDPPPDDRGSDAHGGSPIAAWLRLNSGRDTRYHGLRRCAGRLDQHQRGRESDLTSLRAHHDAPFADDKY